MRKERPLVWGALKPLCPKPFRRGLFRWSVFGFRAHKVFFARSPGALGDAGRFSATMAQIIELGAADLAAANHFNGIHDRRIERKHPLDAFAKADLAHREIGV